MELSENDKNWAVLVEQSFEREMEEKVAEVGRRHGVERWRNPYKSSRIIHSFMKLIETYYMRKCRNIYVGSRGN